MTKSEGEKLKPCPFCGKEPRVVEETEGNCQIFCVCELEPMIILPKNRMEIAIRTWNYRHNE